MPSRLSRAMPRRPAGKISLVWRVMARCDAAIAADSLRGWRTVPGSIRAVFSVKSETRLTGCAACFNAFRAGQHEGGVGGNVHHAADKARRHRQFAPAGVGEHLQVDRCWAAVDGTDVS